MKTDKKNQIWLLSSLALALGVITILYVLVCTLCRGVWDEKYKIAFTLFGNEVAWYGIFIAIGFVCAIILSCLKMYKYGISSEPFYFFCFIGVPVAIIGARMGSCFIGQTEWEDYFKTFGQGLAIEWGVMLVVIVALIYFPLILRNEKYFVKDQTNKKIVMRKISMWVYLDCIAPAIFIGQIIGRFGNYFNHEVYGGVINDASTINFLKIFFPWMEDSSHVWRQPTFFYEQIGNIIGLFLIYFVSEIIKSNRIRKAGTLAISYFLWYGIVRIIMTPLRMQGSASGGSGGEEMNLIITICWIVFAFIFLLLNTFIFPKYLRNKRVIYLSFISITFFFKRFFRKNNNILINKYHNDKKKFIREENEIFWYNNF